MKTIKEWLETLPEPYRKLALNNLETKPMVFECAISQRATITEALFDAFYWNESPERADFWFDIHTRAQNGEFDRLDIDCTIPEET
jgi:hypothetical protein